MTTQPTKTEEQPEPEGSPPKGGHGPDDLENYAGGYIQARHGHIPLWLVVVIVGLLLWAVYYGFVYWGGLGDGLDY